MAAVRDQFKFTGLMAPTYAPLEKDGTVNVALIPKYASFLHNNGITGVFLNGTMGEGVSLTVDERIAVTEAWIKSKDMVRSIVVHVGGTNIADVKKLASHADSVGVSAIAALPPIFFRCSTVEDLIGYCQEVASYAPNTPFLYYHIPAMTHVQFPMDEFLRKAKDSIPTLCGMKFTSMEVEGEGVRAKGTCGGTMSLFPGYDQTLTQGCKLGFPGAINGSFNFMPLECGKLFCLASLCEEDNSKCCVPREERDQEIKRIQQRIDKVWEIFAKHGNGYTISAAKMGMTLLTGLEVGPPRCPNLPLPAKSVQAMERDLRQAGFIIS